MKNLLYIVLIFLVSLSSAALGQDAKTPKIFIKEKSHNAGEVTEGTKIEHTYTVYNRGNELLRIEKVGTG